jgi:hypothetical protein
MTKLAAVAAIGITLWLSASAEGQGQAKRYPLDSAAGLVLHHVAAAPATLHGKKGLRLARPDSSSAPAPVEQLAMLPDVVFSNGVIEVELAGAPEPGAAEGARGFVGIAFRLKKEDTYDAFYLRPTNGRADDQERRNHATQYISQPDWPWQRLRQETPGKYESYVDLLPGEWTKIKIDVRGDKARLYVHGAEQPALIVNDVKSGANGSGGVALWIGPETVAHFRDLTITARD